MTAHSNGVATKTITEPAWLDYDRFLSDSTASADQAQYFDDCFAVVKQLGAQVELQADTLRQQIEADTSLEENAGLVLLGEADVIDQFIGDAAKQVEIAIEHRRGVRLERMQPPLAQAYRLLQQAKQYITNTRRHFAAV